MPLICVICRDQLTLQKNGLVMQAIISTECGHMFHQTCFDDNCKYSAQLKADVYGRNRVPTTCPTCKRILDVSQNRKVFPAETKDEPPSQDKNLKLQNDKLKEEVLALKGTVNHLRLTVTALQAVKGKARVSEEVPLVEPRFDPNPRIQAISGGCALAIGNPIVWFGGDGETHDGVVKWLGQINTEMFAGVEFNEAIGNNFPESGGRKLFICGVNRGRLVRIRELVLQKDFYGN